MRFERLINVALAAATLAFAGGGASAKEMVFTSWGGTTQAAQDKAWVKPFEKASKTTVRLDGPTDYGKLKAMVESGNVSWDVVDVEGDFAVAAAKAGLLQPLDFKVIDKSKLDPRFTGADYVGSFYYSFVIGFNKNALGAKTPSSWADLFDAKRFPGKRTFYKWSAPGVLEMALLADGVPAAKLYPLDLDRAFKKLDTIKSDIVWWGSGAQSQQLLASGEAPMGAFWNGRIYAVQKDEPSVGLSWNQNLTAADLLVVPKGAPDAAAAMKFIAEATSAKGQAALASQTSYAPVNLDSPKLMPPSEVAGLPDSHKDGQINLDMTYWAAHRDEIGQRWYAWQAK
jgi:putative spermidine/putrescine transport system substrate-binding protein